MKTDPTRMDVYKVARDLASEVHRLTTDFERGDWTLRDQVRRSSQSVFLNIAEGLGQTQHGPKRKAFAVAQGELAESRAALDLAGMRDLISQDARAACEELADRVAAMLWKLVQTL